MILTRSEILKLIKTKELVIKPFSKKVITTNGLDLSLSDEFAKFVGHNEVIDFCSLTDNDIKKLYEVTKSNEIIIYPKSFILASTIEYIKMPKNVVGLCNLRSTIARYGLSIPPTTIDVGFEGNLVIELVNNSTLYIKLRKGIRFLHVILVKTEGLGKYSGVYRKQMGMRLPKSVINECIDM